MKGLETNLYAHSHARCYGIADEGVFALCEQVCGSLQSQLTTLAALIGGTTD